MGKMVDISNQRFGRLVAVEPLRAEKGKGFIWRCSCDCGGEAELPAYRLRAGNVMSCGCFERERKAKADIAGQRFGRLTVVCPTQERDASGSVVWECLCDCGSTAFFSVSRLKHGKTKSCGCLYRETRVEAVTHRRDLVEGTSLSAIASSKQVQFNSSSGHTGVSMNKRVGKWVAYINFKKKRYYLGSYRELSDAIKARKEAEQLLHDPLIEEMWENMTENSRRKYLASNPRAKPYIDRGGYVANN